MQPFVTLSLVVGTSVLVALPSILAILRKHPHWLAISIVDILLGWTVLGWIAALVWVLRPVRASKPRRRLADRWPRRRAARQANSTERVSDAAANDNAEPALAGPAPLDTDFYADWLEGGSAVPDAETRESPGVPARSPASPRAA